MLIRDGGAARLLVHPNPEPMSLRARILLLVLVSPVVLAGCRSYNIFVGDIAERHAQSEADPGLRCSAPDPRAVRLYYDRDGDLYPASVTDVQVPKALFAIPGDSVRLQDNFFRLERGEQRDPWPALLGRYGLNTSRRQGRDSTLWTEVQDSLAAEAVRDLNARLQPPGEPVRTLVVLVHGFNNKGCEADEAYAILKDRLESRWVDPDRTVYLQLYWDGLGNKIGIPVWANAQFNFPLVGLGFRRVLNQISHDVPVRVVTHSSGGPLIANALWDARAALQRNRHVASYPRYRTYDRYAGYGGREGEPPSTLGRPTHPDIRVGMLVPAMPALTLVDPTGVDRLAFAGSPPAKLVIGVNGVDGVISLAGLGCNFNGSTCLSAGPDEFCDRVYPLAQSLPNRSVVQMVDFTAASRPPSIFDKLGNHTVAAYARHRELPRFFDLLFGVGSGLGDGPSVCDGGPRGDRCRPRSRLARRR